VDSDDRSKRGKGERRGTKGRKRGGGQGAKTRGRSRRNDEEKREGREKRVKKRGGLGGQSAERGRRGKLGMKAAPGRCSVEIGHKGEESHIVEWEKNHGANEA